MKFKFLSRLCVMPLLLLFTAQLLAEPSHGTVKLQFKLDDANGDPLPCRIHLKDEQDEPIKAKGQPFWRDHFVCSGRVAVDLPPGNYRYEIERGPEYERLSGQIELISKNAKNSAQLNLTLRRIADLRTAGWYSGDLHVHRPIDDVELLMRAEDLDLAPVITWWNARNPWKDADIPQPIARQFDTHRRYNIMAGEDEREGGALLYFGLKEPLDLSVESREFPSPMQFVQQARMRQPKVWIDIEKPFWWDVPVWLASGQANSIGLANNHMCRGKMYESEAWGRPRDEKRLPAPRGNGFWTQEIYYQILNSGLRIPPSAGSASGVLPNPVGYNRVYVQLDEPFTRDAWFRGLSHGRCFVTNGPLLLANANGQWPGATLKMGEEASIDVALEVQLTSRDRISRLELIHNGTVAKTIDVTADVSQQHRLHVTLDKPGWFLVRAITDVEETFRFASTAAWYVESSSVKHHISRAAAQFFLEWVDERIERVHERVSDAKQLRAILEWHEKARTFWAGRVAMANAE